MQTAAVTCVAVRWRDRADANCPLPVSPQSLPLLTPRMTGDRCRSELWMRDWRLWCMLAEHRASFINECHISTLGVSLSVHTLVIPASICPAYQLDYHVACRRRDAFWCLFCLAITDERLYVVATVVDPRYPGQLFSMPKLVCAKQWLLEEYTTAAAAAAGENREAEEQTGPPTKRQRVDDAQPDSSSVLDACLNQFLALADKR